jgi:hypothetical protein
MENANIHPLLESLVVGQETLCLDNVKNVKMDCFCKVENVIKSDWLDVFLKIKKASVRNVLQLFIFNKDNVKLEFKIVLNT